MTKLSKECIQQLFPMTKAQINKFLAECKHHSCPDFMNSNCKNIVHPLEQKLKDIYLDVNHNWKEKNKYQMKF